MQGDLKPGQKVFIRLRGEDRAYLASLEKVDSKKIKITTPMYRQLPLELKAGNEIVVGYAGKGARFVFETSVLSVQDGFYTVTAPLHLVRIQERSNVRLPVNLNVAVLGPDEGTGPQTLRMVNLSSSGMQMLSYKNYLWGHLLKLKFELPRKIPISIEVSARVVWAEKVFEEGKWCYRLGVEFVKPAIWQQDEIFRYIFYQMVEQRQRREENK